MSPENKQEVLARLDVRARYVAQGLDIIGNKPNDKGWVQCRAIGRVDKTPSAGINLDPTSPQYGDYNAFIADENNQYESFFDTIAKLGYAANGVDAFNRLVEEVGLIPTEVSPAKMNKDKWFTPRPLTMAQGWLKSKPPCTIEGLTATGGAVAWIDGYAEVMVVPIYSNQLAIQGGAIFNMYGGNIGSAKNLMITGTKAGLMGLHGLNLIKGGKAAIVYLTEGIPDMIALQSLIPEDKQDSVAVVTHSGGAGEYPRDWYVKFFTGQNIIIIPDADIPGMIGGRKWAAALVKQAQSVRFAMLPYEVTPTKGKDLRDWFNDGNTFADLETLTANAEVVVPSADELYSSEFCEKMLNDLKVCIFGQDSEQRIHGYSFHTMNRFVIKDRNRYTYPDLYGHCGQPTKQYVLKTKSTENDVPGKYTFGQVFEVFYQEAAKRYIRNFDLHGQGIWCDPQSKNAVIVFGNGQAAAWNGKTLERITQPFHGDLQLDLQAAHSEFVDFDTLKNALENYDESKAPAAFVQLTKLLMQWNWKVKNKPDKDIIVTLIAALAVASFIQSTLTFRPQVCITGNSYTGKSQIQTSLLAPLFGKLADPVQKPTDAAIRQLVKMNSKMLLIDELERDRKHSHLREKIFKMLRSATGDGGDIIRGTTGHDIIRFRLQHITWLSAIEVDLSDPADGSRFFLFETQRPVEKDGKKSFLHLPKKQIQQIGFDLMVFTIKNMNVLLETMETLSKTDIENTTHRNLDAAAVPAAIAETLCKWTKEETKMFMYCAIHNHSAEKTTQTIDEHDAMLQAILTQIIRVADAGELSILQTIRRANIINPTSTSRTLAKEALERYGIKIIKHHEEQMVFFKTSDKQPEFLRNIPDWKSTNAALLLERVKEAKSFRARFGGMMQQGVGIKIENIIGTKNENENEEF